MKKRLIITLFVILALLIAVLPACSGNSHEHDYSTEEVITAAGCETAGKAKYTCECGESIEKDIPAAGHKYGDVQTLNPTCKDNGKTYKVCSVCEHEEKIETLPADKSATSPYHKFDKEVTTQPDCSTGTDGIHKWVCSLCNTQDPNRTPEITTAQHNFRQATEEEGALAPTCTDDGVSFEICENCGYAGPANITSKTGHTEEVVSSSPAGCGTNAKTSYKCTVCLEEWDIEEEGTALQHSYEGQPVLTQKPTCTESGYTYQECANCGTIGNEQMGASKLGHDFAHEIAEKTERVDSTCCTDGYETKICSRCDVKDEPVTIPATNLHYVTYEVIGARVEASCHNAAYEVWHCTGDAKCQETKRESEKIDNPVAQLSHQFVAQGAPVPSTCSMKGYTLYVCTVCSLEDATACEDGCSYHGDEQPYAPHEMSQIFEDTFVDSTCIKPATVEFLCNNCNERYDYTYPLEGTEDAIPLKAHFTNERRTDTVEAPSCTAEGYREYRCTTDSECTEICFKEYTRRAEHAFTVYSDGRIVCDVCNVTYRDISTHTDEAIASSAQLQAEIDRINADDSLSEEEKAAAIAKAKEDFLGPLVVKDAQGNIIASFDWELIGYGKPTETPDKVEGEGAGYGEEELVMSMNAGVIALTPTVKSGVTTYVIKITDGEGAVATYTIDLKYNESHGYFEIAIYSGEGDDADLLTPNPEDAATITVNDTFYFDLYDCEDVAGIEITASAETTVRLYANEG